VKKYRIFLVIGGKATPGDNNNMWVRNLYDPLVALGHDVYLLNIDDYAERQGLGYMSPQAKERLSNELPGIFLKEHTHTPFDIFFSYLHNAQIIPEVLLEIKRHVYTINYSTNYHQFEMYKEVAKNVDYNIYISKIAKAGFDSLNVKSYWMPLAANPTFYQPSSNKNNDSVFIGSVYGPRALLFWRLLQYGVNLKLYGQGWLEKIETEATLSSKKGLKSSINEVLYNLSGYEIKKRIESSGIIKPISLEQELRDTYSLLNEKVLRLLRRDFFECLNPSLSDAEYVKVMAEAGIVVNIQESRFDHDYFNHQVLFGSNLRDYEATMCRSLLCTQYSHEIEELFDVGIEIICYHNEHDLSDKLKYYTNNVGERDSIAEKGYLKSLKDHTWERRFESLFDILIVS
jgi:hypothetical protein